MENLFLMIGTTEIILIAAIVLLLFGGKKLPELMRGMGQGVRSFKEGMNEITTPADQQPAAKDQEKTTEKPQQ